jgi:hypothetical protein
MQSKTADEILASAFRGHPPVPVTPSIKTKKIFT